MSKKKKNFLIDIYNQPEAFDFFRPIDLDNPVDTTSIYNIQEKAETPLSSTTSSHAPTAKKEKTRPSMHAIAKLLLQSMELLVFNGLIFVYQSGIYVRLTMEMLISFVQTHLKEDLLNAINIRLFDDILRYLKGLDIPLYEFGVNEPIFAWNTGLINLSTGKQGPLSPKNPLFSKVDIDSFPGFKKTSERFLRVLEQMARGDAQIIQRILEFMGYCLISAPLGKYFFVLGTAKDSGKSKVIAGLLERLIGTQFHLECSSGRSWRKFWFGFYRSKKAKSLVGFAFNNS